MSRAPGSLSGFARVVELPGDELRLVLSGAVPGDSPGSPRRKAGR